MKPRPDRPICKTSSEYRRERYQCAALGAAAGCALALIAAVLIGWGLDSWRVANHERLLAEAIAAERKQFTALQKQLERYAEVDAVARAYDARRPSR